MNKLDKELNYFLKENNNEAITKQNICDTMKAIIRGTMISYTAKRNKEKYKENFKLQAFADDLIFIMEGPEQTGPKLIEKLEEYREVAGLKINKGKMKIIAKNMTNKQKEKLAKNLDIQIVPKIKYLGITILYLGIHWTARCSTLKENIYIKLKQQIALDLVKWENLQLSLIGRISTIKMNILPRILYLFQTIPIRLGKDYFEDLNKIVLIYIWLGKKARIKLKLFQDAKIRGGFGLPNCELYYQATNLMWVKEWITLRNTRLFTLEGHDLLLGWHAFLWYKGTKTQGYFRRYYIRESLWLNWEKTKRQYTWLILPCVVDLCGC
uniref:Uncharacterized protein n=1 Tax=Pseudonaja textilis TaxID=8673 RepID=A0A670ZFJ1_PSETE